MAAGNVDKGLYCRVPIAIAHVGSKKIKTRIPVQGIRAVADHGADQSLGLYPGDPARRPRMLLICVAIKLAAGKVRERDPGRLRIGSAPLRIAKGLSNSVGGAARHAAGQSTQDCFHVELQAWLRKIPRGTHAAQYRRKHRAAQENIAFNANYFPLKKIMT